ncbi:hypothetical protein SLS58_005492 [Diplodia intermedia]|uniref:Pyrroline-5-carboxylate reductase n=1 Tax=Diplodia intermedia TaxID=856260 RepID=A0ABR3TR56_9PEZI
MSTELKDATTLCVLGCGNLGTAILTNLINPPPNESDALPFTHFIACRFSQTSTLTISRNDNIAAVQNSHVIVLAADPADIATVLTQPGLRDALAGKLLISVAAGWTRGALETTLYGSETSSSTSNQNDASRARVVRTLPNIAALVSQSLTAIEVSDQPVALMMLPDAHLALTERIFARIGRTARVAPRAMDAATAVAGSTPAFFAVVCDALVDAGVAVGVPRAQAGAMVFQAMAGAAAMLQSGVHVGALKDRGTSPEGCTIGGLMVLEEAGVRGHLGRALREAVTVARMMGRVEHPNDTTRQ